MRLFVALDIPDAVRETIGALIAKLRRVFPHGRWVRIEGAHVTLKFIGEVPSDTVKTIEAALKTVQLPKPFEMNFRGAGFFPDARRPRVFWAGIEAGAELGALASSVNAALEPLGIPRETRAFSPHLTLARFDSPRGLDDLRKAIADSGALEFGRAVAREISSLSERAETRRGRIYSAGDIRIRRERITVNQAIVASTPILWLLVLAGYMLGSIPFGFLLVRMRSGRDVRYVGSGNIGATNVARAAGWSTGISTLILDTAKGFVAVWLIAHFSSGSVRFMMYAGLAAILGHLFPMWLGFSGGKGVATAAGVFLAICWPSVAAAGALFVIVLLFWRYVSLASVSAAAALPLFVYILYAPGHAPPTTVSAGTLLAAIMVIMKHRGNIERLMSGTEPPFEMGRKKS